MYSISEYKYPGRWGGGGLKNGKERGREYKVIWERKTEGAESNMGKEKTKKRSK